MAAELAPLPLLLATRQLSRALSKFPKHAPSHQHPENYAEHLSHFIQKTFRQKAPSIPEAPNTWQPEMVAF